MSIGDRIKYDYISGMTTNITNDEKAIEEFIASHGNEVIKLRTAVEGGRNLKTSRKMDGVSVSKTGKVKLRLRVFGDLDTFRDRNVVSVEQAKEISAEKMREKRMEQRRAARAARIAAENSE